MRRRQLERLGSAKWAILGLVAAGGVMVAAGAFAGGGYGSSALLEIGAALFLAVPLLFLERLMESRIARMERAARASIEDVRTEVEGVRDDVRHARTQIDELGRATSDRIEAAREADAGAVRSLRDDVTERNTWQLLHRAQELMALDPRGVRVRVPGSELRVRFVATEQPAEPGRAGAVELRVEDRDGERLASEERWTLDVPADQPLTQLAEELQRAGRYPGDESFDAGAIFERLADTIEVVLTLRTGGRAGAQLAPVVELVGHWAITTEGLEHTLDERRAVRTRSLLSEPDQAREALGGATDATLSEALDTACAYHSGEDRRAARARFTRDRERTGAPT